MGTVTDPAKRKPDMHDLELTAITRLSDHALEVQARLLPPVTPAEEPWTFRPGQWVYLIDSQGFREDRRAYSLASSPAMAALEFGIEIVPKGLFSPRVLRWQVGDRFSFRGPYGTFQLPAQPDKPIAFLGFNSGIVPLVSMLRTRLIEAGDAVLPYSCVYLRTGPEFALFEGVLAELAAAHPNFRYQPIDTGSLEADQWPDAAVDEVLATAAQSGAWCYAAGLGKFIGRVQARAQAAGVAAAMCMTERYD